jgi:riboflavin kinase/FMN adenylyltransferase
MPRSGGWQSGHVERWNGIDDVPAGFGPSAVTIGNFDGVHRGHQAVLTRLVEHARERDARAVAITFQPHPIAVLFPERAPTLLDTMECKLQLLADTGLDAVLVMEFTRELASWSPERFVRDVIVDVLGAREVVVGRDTRFGHRNSGDVNTLRTLGARYGFGVELLEDLGVVDSGHPTGRRWSSTWVRALVASGDVREAAVVLGRPPRVTGAVVHGDHRGRQLGFPTANLSPSSIGVVPADGVYAGWLLRLVDGGAEEARLPAAISIGTNPTFDGHGRRVEAHVLDRDDLELYGETVAVEFIDRLRPTLRFTDVDALVRRMKADVEQCRQVFAEQAASSGATDRSRRRRAACLGEERQRPDRRVRTGGAGTGGAGPDADSLPEQGRWYGSRCRRNGRGPREPG